MGANMVKIGLKKSIAAIDGFFNRFWKASGAPNGGHDCVRSACPGLAGRTHPFQGEESSLTRDWDAGRPDSAPGCVSPAATPWPGDTGAPACLSVAPAPSLPAAVPDRAPPRHRPSHDLPALLRGTNWLGPTSPEDCPARLPLTLAESPGRRPVWWSCR